MLFNFINFTESFLREIYIYENTSKTVIRIKNKHGRRGKIGKKLKKYDELSPFELKNILIKLAKGKDPRKMLNAGRGNPDFFNIFVRKIFSHMQYACSHISTRLEKIPGREIFRDLHDYPPAGAMNYKKAIISKMMPETPPRERKFVSRLFELFGKRS